VTDTAAGAAPPPPARGGRSGCPRPSRQVRFGVRHDLLRRGRGAAKQRRNSLNGSVDCSPSPNLWENSWIGFAEHPDSLCLERAPSGYGTRGTYTWSFSASDTDPFQNVGQLPADRWLYLWLADKQRVPGGLSATEFGLRGSLILVDFEPLDGAWIPGLSLPDILLAATECEDAPFLAGRILVERPTPISRGSWGGNQSPVSVR
jgi:hypothetical protein